MDPEVYAYPGGRKEYRAQALQVLLVALAVGGLLLLLVRGVSALTEAQGSLTPQLLLLLLLLGIMAALLLSTARSMADFRLELSEEGVTVKRPGAATAFIPYSDIQGVELVRRVGWFPLRPDLKSRSTSARHMVRIRRRGAGYLVFAGGIEREEELVALLLERSRSAGAGGEGA